MIAIVDYKAGNLKSVELAVRKVGFPCTITSDAEEIYKADRIIFPGVGAAGKAMANLTGMGLDKVIIRAFEEKKPILGICLGAQIILEKSEENNAFCLGLMKGEVRHFPNPLFSFDNERLKIPHMGWNSMELYKEHPVLKGITPFDEFYFVHSYYPDPANEKNVIGKTKYGIEFPSVIGYRNLVAMQFHPEKSGTSGLKILKNFCTWDGMYAE